MVVTNGNIGHAGISFPEIYTDKFSTVCRHWHGFAPVVCHHDFFNENI